MVANKLLCSVIAHRSGPLCRLERLSRSRSKASNALTRPPNDAQATSLCRTLSRAHACKSVQTLSHQKTPRVAFCMPLLTKLWRLCGCRCGLGAEREG